MAAKKKKTFKRRSVKESLLGLAGGAVAGGAGAASKAVRKKKRASAGAKLRDTAKAVTEKSLRNEAIRKITGGQVSIKELKRIGESVSKKKKATRKKK